MIYMLKKNEIKRRSLSEANTIYPKRKFEGNLIKKAYMIGFRLGDLNVKKELNIIITKGNTTIPEQVELIKNVYGCYGHFYVKKKDGVYHISCSLDKSFSFLLKKEDNIPTWIIKKKNLFFAFLAGYTDAEGCIKINQNRARYRVGSYDKNLLKQVYLKLIKFGLTPTYRLETKAGTIHKGLRMNGDFYRVSVNKKDS